MSNVTFPATGGTVVGSSADADAKRPAPRAYPSTVLTDKQKAGLAKVLGDAAANMRKRTGRPA